MIIKDLNLNKEQLLETISEQKKNNEIFIFSKDLIKKWVKDKDVVSEILRNDGKDLEYVVRYNKKFKKDRDLILISVKTFGNALQHASDELRADKDIVSLAIESQASALFYASEDLKNNRELQVKAIEKSIYCLEWLSKNSNIDIDKEMLNIIISSDILMPRILNALNNQFFLNKNNVDLILEKLFTKGMENSKSIKMLDYEVQVNIIEKICICENYAEVFDKIYKNKENALKRDNLLEEWYLNVERVLMEKTIQPNTNKQYKKIKF